MESFKAKEIEGQSPFRYAVLKKKDKRIIIAVYELPDQTMAVLIKTKKLVDRKTRNIVISQVSYGCETTLVVKEVLQMLFNDPQFNMKFNREIGQVAKDKMHCRTNIDY